MFDNLIQTLNAGGGSVRAYENCARQARMRVAEEPDNAIALLLIAYASQRFVDAYNDQPLTIEVATSELAEMRQLIEKLDSAWRSESAEQRLKASNDVSQTIISEAQR